LREQTARAHQLRVCPALDDAAVVHYDDSIRVDNGAEAVRDDHPRGLEPVEAFADKIACVRLSRALVASSKNRILGRLTMARAFAMEVWWASDDRTASMSVTVWSVSDAPAGGTAEPAP